MDELQQIREVAQSLGIKVHHKWSVETLKSKINQQQRHAVEDVMKHRAELNLNPVDVQSEEDVIKALGPIADKEGFVIKFYPDHTWYMAYKGAEDSGHMSMPLRAFRMKAENVAVGKRSPRALEAAKPGMMYSDAVLA